MRMQIGIFLLFIIAMISTNRALADFQWASNWQATPIGTGPSQVYFDFDLPNGGSVRADAMSSTQWINQPPLPPAITATGDAGSTITRTFSLTGSADGWRINLDAYISGTTGGLHGGASSTLSAKIDQLDLISTSISQDGGGSNIPHSNQSHQFVILPDGLYNLFITHTATSYVAPPAYQGPLNFGNVSDQSSLYFTATPVPEAGLTTALCVMVGVMIVSVGRVTALVKLS